MEYFVIALVGFAGGAISVFFALDKQKKRIEKLKQEVDAQDNNIHASREDLRNREQQLQQKADTVLTAVQNLEDRTISYDNLRDENSLVKRDLRNLAINVKKLELDRQQLQQSQDATDNKVKELGGRYLKENVKLIGKSLNPDNYSKCKQRLLGVIERCRGIGFDIVADEETSYVGDLRTDYEQVVRAALEREEQARIKAQIREEQQREREIQREMERIERDRDVLEKALAKALAAAEDEHSAEIESLRARLAEANDKKRAISQAQLTKAGFVYVISNIGSFGEGVFKIGMTRRLVPEERVKELGDASVPFPFDIHMMISCENAPVLEKDLHRFLHKQQVNKTNPRKEFFRSDINSIVEIVKERHGEVEYVADAEALQYRQSLSMSDEDQEFIEHTFEQAVEEKFVDADSVDNSLDR